MTWLRGTPCRRRIRFGNRYYQEQGRQAAAGFIYNGTVEASRVPAGVAWMAAPHLSRAADGEAACGAAPWQLNHLPNMTGTAGAQRPQGSLAAAAQRPAAAGDYEAWMPN